MRPENLDRREFLATGTGLFVFFGAETVDAYQQPAAVPAQQTYPTDFNAFLHIGADGRVGCFAGKVELGQGATTALAQCLAEELDVTYDSVDVLLSDTDLCPWDSITMGSMTMFRTSPVLRAAAAEARAVLLQMAAERLGAPVERLKVNAGVVTDPAQDKRVTYAQLVGGQRIERHMAKVPVKPVAEFKVIGQSPRRKDGLDKVTGKARYAADITLPGMLYARMLRPPAHGATLKDVDTSASEKIARVVKDGDMIAVLHERPDMAAKALGLIKAQFDRPRTGVDDKTIFTHLIETGPPPQLVFESGSLAEGEKLASAIAEETYLNAYVAHAPIETHSAVAKIEGGKATVWVGTQSPFPVKQEVAAALGFAPENVRIIAPYVGGAFGGKGIARQAIEAARLAKLTGRPVQVVFTRAEEFFFDNFRPAAVVKIRAGVSDAGKIALWDYKVWGAGDRESKTVYDIPHQRTVSSGGWQGGAVSAEHVFSVGPWRAPSCNTNTFARESHIDILAAKAGVDPVEFRLNHLTEPRMRRLLEAAAKQFGWKPAKGPSGRGVGVACCTYRLTSVANMAEVAVDKNTGHVQVKRVVSAIDLGVAVNPDGVRQQLESGITMGLGYALREEVRFQDGEIFDRDFDTYGIPRFSWVPKIETILIENPTLPAQGCGEPVIINSGAVVANAIFDAVGARVLQLPMTPERVKAAMGNRS